MTYFAILRDKAAFGLEASKYLSSGMRAYYHLQMIEAFMTTMGIEFERPFDLTAEAVTSAIDSNVAVAFYGNRSVPGPGKREGARGVCSPAQGLGAGVPPQQSAPHHGGRGQKLRGVLRQQAAYPDSSPNISSTDYGLDSLEMTVDGKTQTVPFGSMVSVSENFTVAPISGGRVNVIGFTQPGQEDEAGLSINKSEILPRFSLDNTGGVFRVEAYRDGKFAGMVLVRFGGGQKVRYASREFSPLYESIVIRKLVDSEAGNPISLDEPGSASR